MEDGCHLEVFLVSGDHGWELDQWRFRCDVTAPAKHAHRGDRYGRLATALTWTRAMKAIVLLVLRHAATSDTWATVQGGRGTPARTLANLLEHPERSSAATAFSDHRGHCHLKNLLELNTAGRDPGGAVRHAVGFRAHQLPPHQVQVHLDGQPCRDAARLNAVADELATAWSPAVRPAPASPPRPARPTIDLNDAVARFYRDAVQHGWLQATTHSLADLVPGALHLAFTSSRQQEFDYAHSGGTDGDSFLLSTMSTADSHPLIYRCQGQVHSISEVLSATAWRERAMYRAARPHLQMGDALGSDWRLADGRMLNACTIREQRSFTEQDRRALAWLAPHLRNAASLHLGPPTSHRTSRHLRILPLADLPTGTATFQRELSAHLAPLAPQPDARLHQQVSQWWRRHQTSSRQRSRASWFRAADGLTVVCVPPGPNRDGAIVAGLTTG